MLYDLTVPISPAIPVYPGDPPTELRRVMDAARGDPYTLSALTMSCHTGTHVDAPLHYFPDGAAVDQIPLATLVGRAQILDLDGWSGNITVEAIAPRLEAGVERLLLKTRNSELWARHQGELAPTWVGLDATAAEWLVRRGVRLVGIDYLSLEPPDSADFATHRTLLRSGVVILEGLDLTGVPPGGYQLCCLPLKLPAAEGAPARVVVVGPGV